jgi:multiple sugar transport system substrate-binding protein
LGIVDETPDPATSDDYEIDMMRYNNARAVEARFNVILEGILPGDYGGFGDAFVAHQLANDPIADLVLLSPSMLIPAMAANHVIDLNTLQFAGSDLFGANRYMKPNFIHPDGRMLNFGGNEPSRQPAWGLNYNLSMINRLGLPDPMALYDAGNWTWDAFLNHARAASAAGYWGVSGWTGDFAIMALASNDGRLATDDFRFALDNPNAMQTFELIETLLQENLYWNEPGNTDSIWDWTSLSLGFGAGNIMFSAAEFWHGNSAGMDWENPAFDLRIIPFPRGPMGTGRTMGLDNVDGGWSIPVGVENPQLVLQVMEALMAWPGDDVWLLADNLRADTRRMVGSERCIDIWFEIGAAQTFDPGLVAGLRGLVGDVFVDMFQGWRTAAESVEYRRGPAQEELETAARLMGVR